MKEIYTGAHFYNASVRKKGLNLLIMIAINKAEKDAIVERFPNVHIVRTMKQDSKRGHYFCTEEPRVMRYLQKIRNIGVVEVHEPKRKSKKRG